MPSDDQTHAAVLAAHRSALQAAIGDELAGRPWQVEGQPASAADLVRWAAWKAADPEVEPALVVAGLGLLESARAELDQVEAGLLFAARAAGVTFQQIAAALQLGSGQAAQQRMSRVLSRLDRS